MYEMYVKHSLTRHSAPTQTQKMTISLYEFFSFKCPPKVSGIQQRQREEIGLGSPFFLSLFFFFYTLTHIQSCAWKLCAYVCMCSNWCTLVSRSLPYPITYSSLYHIISVPFILYHKHTAHLLVTKQYNPTTKNTHSNPFQILCPFPHNLWGFWGV